jgi:dihydroorotate dehydrogenase (fumarate)
MNVELNTFYLGLPLAHPIVASAGPLTGRIDTLVALQEAGAAAVVLPSLFEEDVHRDMALTLQASRLGALVHAESSGQTLLPVGSLDVATRHIRLVLSAKNNLKIPVIASLNGISAGGWVRYAAELTDAGADALELNVYRVVANTSESSQSVEEAIVSLIAAVRAQTPLPISVKLSPYFSALGSFARRIVEEGINGVVMFNRFYQTEIDLSELTVLPSLDLSTSADLRLPLRWTALLSGNINADIALSGGVHEPTDVVKALLVGASAVMTTSSLLRNGIEHLTRLRDGLQSWLIDKEYQSVEQLRGSMSVGNVPEPDAYERANYLHVIQTANQAYGLHIDRHRYA